MYKALASSIHKCWKATRFRKEYLATKKKTVTIDYIVLPRVSSCLGVITAQNRTRCTAIGVHAWMRNRLISNALKHIAMDGGPRKERLVRRFPSARNNRSWQSVLLIHLNILYRPEWIHFRIYYSRQFFRANCAYRPAGTHK